MVRIIKQGIAFKTPPQGEGITQSCEGEHKALQMSFNRTLDLKKPTLKAYSDKSFCSLLNSFWKPFSSKWKCLKERLSEKLNMVALQVLLWQGLPHSGNFAKNHLPVNLSKSILLYKKGGANSSPSIKEGVSFAQTL